MYNSDVRGDSSHGDKKRLFKLEDLLEEYYNEAEFLHQVYSKMERRFMMIEKLLMYPSIVLASSSMFINTTNVITLKNKCDANSSNSYFDYFSAGMSYAILLLTGFQSYLAPGVRKSRFNQFSSEFGDIASDIKQFVAENNYNYDELRYFTNLTRNSLDTWINMSDTVPESLIKKMRGKYIEKKLFNKDK